MNNTNLNPKIEISSKYTIKNRIFTVIDCYFSNLHNQFSYKLIDDFNTVLWFDEYVFFSDFYNFKKVLLIN